MSFTSFRSFPSFRSFRSFPSFPSFPSFLFSLFFLLFPIHTHAVNILNASYDPTREFYDDYNEHFRKYWKRETGQDVFVKQSHGGSSKQARAVIDGLKADVVTLALAYDIDVIASKKLIAEDWQKRLPFNSSPYNSIIVFLVRKGNPKQIRDWDDLIRDDVSVITPNPKTSGGARWNFLAALGYAMRQNQNDRAKAKAFMEKLFARVPILDTSARGATISFSQRLMGDVLIAWENEAFLAKKSLSHKEYEIVIPSLTIITEPPVSVVDAVVDRQKTRPIAEAYLQQLYSPEAQRMAAKHFYRPSDKQILAEFSTLFPKTETITIADFGGWERAQKEFFSDGGMFDQIYLHHGDKR
jgi:sulfate/thiosulfate-binding protein